MDIIRIPLWIILDIMRDLEKEPNKSLWKFETLGGNLLEVKRIMGFNKYNIPYDSLDFTYNPGD